MLNQHKTLKGINLVLVDVKKGNGYKKTSSFDVYIYAIINGMIKDLESLIPVNCLDMTSNKYKRYTQLAVQTNLLEEFHLLAEEEKAVVLVYCGPMHDSLIDEIKYLILIMRKRGNIPKFLLIHIKTRSYDNYEQFLVKLDKPYLYSLFTVDVIELNTIKVPKRLRNREVKRVKSDYTSTIH